MQRLGSGACSPVPGRRAESVIESIATRVSEEWADFLQIIKYSASPTQNVYYKKNESVNTSEKKLRGKFQATVASHIKFSNRSS